MKYSKEKVSEVLMILSENGANVHATCQACGITRKTFYEWVEKYPAFAEEVAHVREGCIDNVESAVYKEALEGNTSAAALYLNSRAKDRGYGYRQNSDFEQMLLQRGVFINCDKKVLELLSYDDLRDLERVMRKIVQIQDSLRKGEVWSNYEMLEEG